MKKFQMSTKFKYGASATAFTAIVIVAIILVNLLASVVTDRFNLKADMTADQRYDISDATVEMLQNVQNDITIYMLAPRADVVDTNQMLGIYGPSIGSILDRYPGLSNGKVKVEYIDIERNPAFTQGFQLGEISEYSILVKSDAAYRLLTYYDYIYFRAADSYSEEQPVGLNLEHALASAIYYCDTGSKRNAVLLDGGLGDDDGTGADKLTEHAAYCGIVGDLLGDNVVCTVESIFDGGNALLLVYIVFCKHLRSGHVSALGKELVRKRSQRNPVEHRTHQHRIDHRRMIRKNQIRLFDCLIVRLFDCSLLKSLVFRLPS